MDFVAALKWLISSNATTLEVDMGRVGEPPKVHLSAGSWEVRAGASEFVLFTHDVLQGTGRLPHDRSRRTPSLHWLIVDRLVQVHDPYLYNEGEITDEC